MARTWRVVFLSLLLVLLAVSGPMLYFKDYLDNPTNMGTEPFDVKIERGMSVREVAEVLKSRGVIKTPFDFRLLCRLMDAAIPAGEYEISPMLKPIELVQAFAPKNLALRRVTIPEGARLRDIAVIVESKLGSHVSSGIDASSFLKICSERSFAAYLGIEAFSLEGYLFPETYRFEPGTSASKVVERMVREFFEVMGPQHRKRILELNTSLHEIVTIASMVEKETALDEERPIISAVIHNRLRRNMPLQIDAAVIYGLKEFDGNLTRAHLETDTEYNTYTRKGMPPGPICSPSEKSLLAALYPQDVDYLYFVSTNNGHHRFSSTMQEHNIAVRLFQRQRSSQQGGQ